MYLFSRQARLGAGRIRDGLAWATAQCERVNRITGLPVTLYAHSMSPGLGTMAWTTFVPDLATLEEANDKLMVDDGFLEASELGGTFAPGGADDVLLQLIHGEPDPARDIQYVSAVSAVCAAGNGVRGIEVGVQIAQTASEITGVPTLFLSNVTGSYGGVVWISGYESIEVMESTQADLSANADWLASIDRDTAGVYVEDPNLTVQTIYRKVA